MHNPVRLTTLPLQPALIYWPLLTTLLPSPAFADGKTDSPGQLLIAAAALYGVLLTILLITQRSRLKHKAKKRRLAEAHQELELRVVERTDKLRSLNAKLYEEIDHHEATEKLLRETQEYLHSIINSMPSIIIGVTNQLIITHWNSSAERATGTPAAQALGRQLPQIYPRLNVSPKQIQEIIKRGVAQLSENIQQGEGSSTQYCDISIYPLKTSDAKSAVIRIDDVTLRVHMENMMIQNEKMMSLGELAAGMAHEINNPLSAVIQSCQNIQRRLSGDLEANHRAAQSLDLDLKAMDQYLQEREISTFINNIKLAGERAAGIVSNMLSFSRFSQREHDAVDIIELIEQTLQMVSISLRLDTLSFDDILINRSYPENEIPVVYCSAIEIQQVILNILRNAAQAMADQQNSDPAQIAIGLSFDEQQFCIEISDNGPGMDDYERRHIFEPFFTTKEVGQGTGLGLSVSYFIITEHHNGTIEVDSSAGFGTRFIIRLPLG